MRPFRLRFVSLGLYFTFGCGMMCFASEDNVIRGVPFGKSRGCNADLASTSRVSRFSKDDSAPIFEELIKIVRAAKATRVKSGPRGAHTWEVTGTTTLTVAMIATGLDFYLLVESREFVIDFVVADAERRRRLLTMLMLSVVNDRPPVEAAEPREIRNFDGLLL